MSRAASAIKDVKILTREEIKNKSFDEVVEAYFALAELVFELQSIRDSQNGQILHLCVKTEELQTTIGNLKERIRLLISRKYPNFLEKYRLVDRSTYYQCRITVTVTAACIARRCLSRLAQSIPECCFAFG